MNTNRRRLANRWIFLAVSLALMALYARFQLVYTLAFAGQVLVLIAGYFGITIPVTIS